MKILSIVLIACLAIFAQTFHPIQDAFVLKSDPVSNYGADDTLMISSNLFNYNNISRTLVEFDLSSIPPSTPVISAIFNIYMYNQAGIDFDVDIHSALFTWQEMNVNWNNQPIHDTDIVATLPYQGYDWWRFDLTNVVQLWVDNPAINHGFKMMFRIEQYPDSLGRVAYFYSRDTTFNQPYLELVLGIEESQTTNPMTSSLNPNPASRSTVLKINSPDNVLPPIAIYDVQGRLIRIIKRDFQLRNKLELSINVQSMAAGIYFLKIDTDSQQFMMPLVIIK